MDTDRGLFKGQFTTAQVGGGRGAEVQRRRREDRGAEGGGRALWGGGVPSLPHWGRGLCPLPRKIIDFGSQYGKFWCILDGIF